MGKVVGIDLGTTFSVVAYIDRDGNSRILHNEEGETLTPSAVLFLNDDVLVGKVAKDNRCFSPDNYVAAIKRKMGSRSYKFQVNSANGSSNDNSYNAESISAIILKKLMKDAKAAIGDDIDGAVITVPAYFYNDEKAATINAAKIAGIKVLGIINEPTAAALAYGMEKNNLESQNIMVYDLGGGTFDVSIINSSDEGIKTLSSCGSKTLGGYDFDKKIVDYLSEEIEKKGISIKKDALTTEKLFIAAEQAKKTLSAATKANIMLEISNTPFMTSITREQFEKMIDADIYSTTVQMKKALQEAELTYDDIDKILLIGGSTRIPKISEYIKEVSGGISPSLDINPDEAVAIGAAYHAVKIVKDTIEAHKKDLVESEGDIPNDSHEVFHMIEDTDNDSSSILQDIKFNAIKKVELPDNIDDFTFVDRTSHGIGVVIEDGGNDVNVVILPKNSVIPASASMIFRTFGDFQRKFELDVTEGESDNVKRVRTLGSTVLQVKPRKEPAPIEVIISYDKNSDIHISVRDVNDDEYLGEMDIKYKNNLTDAEVEREKKRLGKLNIGE